MMDGWGCDARFEVWDLGFIRFVSFMSLGGCDVDFFFLPWRFLRFFLDGSSSVMRGGGIVGSSDDSGCDGLGWISKTLSGHMPGKGDSVFCHSVVLG